MPAVRVVIATDHASAAFGGEAALALHYFRVLRKRQISVWLVTHERTRCELEALFPDDRDRIVFIPDTAWHRLLWQLGKLLPTRLSGFTTGFGLRLLTQFAQGRVIRRLVTDESISVVHQPMPVSPKEPSMIFGVGAPVIIGPMNGGMNYPPGFRRRQGLTVNLPLTLGRALAGLLNWIIPGKRKAALLLVANERTRQALPRGIGTRVETIVENGVDLSIWSRLAPVAPKPTERCTRFIFIGRLVNWKAVDLLLMAFKNAASKAPMRLAIVGEGHEQASLERMTREMGLSGEVSFLGWMSQAQCAEQLEQSDVLVLPSLLECGGAVVLEAMAMELPVIATAWGGPRDYLDPSCGILVEPTTEEAMVENLAAALVRLARNPQERVAMGKAGRDKVIRDFDWEAKLDRMLELYRSVI